MTLLLLLLHPISSSRPATTPARYCDRSHCFNEYREECCPLLSPNHLPIKDCYRLSRQIISARGQLLHAPSLRARAGTKRGRKSRVIVSRRTEGKNQQTMYRRGEAITHETLFFSSPRFNRQMRRHTLWSRVTRFRLSLLPLLLLPQNQHHDHPANSRSLSPNLLLPPCASQEFGDQWTGPGTQDTTEACFEPGI